MTWATPVANGHKAIKGEWFWEYSDNKLDQVEDAMLGFLEPETREKIIGHAEVKQVFKIKRGRAAGCIIKDGKVTRKAHARVIRGGTP